MKWLKRYWKDLLAMMVILLASLVLVESTQSGFFQIDQQNDPNVFKYVGRVIKDGGMPYRDTFDHKGPVLYILNYLGVIINYDHGLWLIQVLTISLTISLIYLICRKPLSKSPFFSLLVALLGISPLLTFSDNTYNITETYVLPMILGASYIFIDYFINKKLSAARLILCGALLGLAILVKPNYAIVWIAFSIGVLCKLAKEKQLRELLRYVALFAMGTILTMSPFLLWIAASGAWDDFIYQFITFNFAYSSSAEWSTTGDKLGSAIFLLRNLSILIPVALSICLLVPKNLLKNTERLVLTTYLLAIASTIAVTAISGHNFSHYGYTFASLTFLPYVLVFGHIKKDQVIIASIASVYVLINLIFIPWLNVSEKALSNYNTRGDNHLPTDVTNVANLILQNTTPDDKIVIVGHWDFMLNYTRRLSSSKYSYQVPIAIVDLSIADAFFTELEEKTPKMIVVNTAEPILAERLVNYVKNHKYTHVYQGDNNVKVYYKGEA